MTDQITYEDIDPEQPAVKPTAEYSVEEYKSAEQAVKDMTPEGYLELVTALNNYEQQMTLPEAGGFAWCILVSEGGTEVNFGSRAVSAVQALHDLQRGIAYATKVMKLHPRAKTGSALPATAQAPTNAPSNALSNAPSDQPAPVAGNAPVAQSPSAPVTGGVVPIVRIEITPSADGKARIAMYSNQRVRPVDKYPFLQYMNTAENCAKLLAPTGAWTPDHFKVAARYDVNYTATWKQSTRTTEKGNYYKDVVSVAKA